MKKRIKAIKANKSSETGLNVKVALWTQIQQMVVTVEGRSFSVLSLGTLTGAVSSAISYYSDDETRQILVIIVPLIMLFGMFFASFNNKVSAILRGYLAGLEENITKELDETVFLWNQGYHQLHHGKYFLTNDSIGILYTIVLIVTAFYCFYNQFKYLGSTFISIILIGVYMILFVAFSFIFFFDLFSNSKSKQYARIYFHLHNNKLCLDKLNIQSQYEKEMRKLLNLSI